MHLHPLCLRLASSRRGLDCNLQLTFQLLEEKEQRGVETEVVGHRDFGRHGISRFPTLCGRVHRRDRSRVLSCTQSPHVDELHAFTMQRISCALMVAVAWELAGAMGLASVGDTRDDDE